MIDETLLIPVNLLKAIGDRRSFVATDSASRLTVEFFKRTDTNSLAAKVTFGPDTEGPPGLAHAASVGAAMSEAMIFAGWAQGQALLSMRFSATYKQMVPVGTTAFIETTVVILYDNAANICATF